MIQINNTPNLIGITIHGDYYDLNQLYDSITDYLHFYFEGKYHDLKNTLEKKQISEEEYRNETLILDDMHTCILGLCYDIRHAYQGDRESEHLKDGNLYYSFDVIYPWALYYLIHLGQILDDWYQPDWLANMEFSYSKQQMRQDRSMIQLFLDTLWINLRDTLGTAVGDDLCNYFDEYSEYYAGGSVYTLGMCYYYTAQTIGRTLDLKKRMLTVMCYELMISDAIIDEDISDDTSTIQEQWLSESRKDYYEALNAIKSENRSLLIIYDNFMDKIYRYTHANTSITERAAEDFLTKQFGDVQWEELKW